VGEYAAQSPRDWHLPDGYRRFRPPLYVYIIFGKDFPANPAWNMQHGTFGFLMDKGGLGNLSTYILSLVRKKNLPANPGSNMQLIFTRELPAL